jgi:hypothetical protein
MQKTIVPVPGRTNVELGKSSSNTTSEAILIKKYSKAQLSPSPRLAVFYALFLFHAPSQTEDEG